jgi:thermostable 8-oxoguanine DNA glycosylase
VSKPILTESQAARLRKLVRLYPKPKMEKSWKRRTPDELWLRTLSQIVVAGNAGPGDTLRHSPAVRERLAFSRLKKLPPRLRRERIHRVLQAIGTRYVGKKTPNRKVEAAVHNFNALADAGGPKKFFERVAALPTEKERIEFLHNRKKTLQYYGKKAARDTLIDLGLAMRCLALDARILGLLQKVGVEIKKGSLNRNYEKIEDELIEKVAKRCSLSGGQLDRILFQNSGDLMVRLLCP